MATVTIELPRQPRSVRNSFHEIRQPPCDGMTDKPSDDGWSKLSRI